MERFKETVPLELNNDIDNRFKQKTKNIGRDLERVSHELNEKIKQL
jgi:hypothetical protein